MKLQIEFEIETDMLSGNFPAAMAEDIFLAIQDNIPTFLQTLSGDIEIKSMKLI